MRKSLIAAVAALGLSASLMAADVTKSVTVCTKDNKSFTIVFQIHEQIVGNHPILQHLSTTIKGMASQMTAEELLHSGPKFWASLPDETDVDGADVPNEPTITGTCTAS